MARAWRALDGSWYVTQLLALSAEVEAQHAEVVAVLRPLDRRRRRPALLGPVLDQLVVRVARLRPGRSGSSPGEVTSCEYLSELEVSQPVRRLPPSGPAPASPDALTGRSCATAWTRSSLRMSDVPQTPCSFAASRSSSTFISRSSVSLTSGVFDVWLPGASLTVASFSSSRERSIHRAPAVSPPVRRASAGRAGDGMRRSGAFRRGVSLLPATRDPGPLRDRLAQVSGRRCGWALEEVLSLDVARHHAFEDRQRE